MAHYEHLHIDHHPDDHDRKLSLITELIDLHKSRSLNTTFKYLSSPTGYELTSDSGLELYHVKQDSCLDLTDVSTDGERVCVENCSLKKDHDVSDWCITRQIEDMSVRSYKFPQGSTVTAGKCLKVERPFANDQMEYLVAMRSQAGAEEKRQPRVRIRTRLVAPDGTLKALHTQEIPQFYQEIFKYASLIEFV